VDRPYVFDIKEFVKHEKILKKISKEFMSIYEKTARQKKGIVTNIDVDNAMSKSKAKFELTEEENIVVEAYFDTWMGIFTTETDSKLTTQMLNTILFGTSDMCHNNN